MPSLHSQIKQHDRTWHVKLAIRALTAVLALIGIALTAWLLEQVNHHIGPIKGFNILINNDLVPLPSPAIMSILAFIPFGLTVLWFMMYIMFYTLRKRPIHPGWTVAVDLALTAAYIGWTYFTFRSAYEIWRSGEEMCNNVTYTVDMVDDRQYTESFRFACSRKIARIFYAMTIALMTLIFPHFLLFIWGIFDCSHARHQVHAKRMADDMIAERDADRRMESENISVRVV